MDLHYSQTENTELIFADSFTTLWIYTILKQGVINFDMFSVSLPYGFTLFSNIRAEYPSGSKVSLPYGFTLFSNLTVHKITVLIVSLPYGFTLFSNLK